MNRRDFLEMVAAAGAMSKVRPILADGGIQLLKLGVFRCGSCRFAVKLSRFVAVDRACR